MADKSETTPDESRPEKPEGGKTRELKLEMMTSRQTEVRRGGVKVVEHRADVTAPDTAAMPTAHAITRATMRVPLGHILRTKGLKRSAMLAAAAVVPVLTVIALLLTIFTDTGYIIESSPGDMARRLKLVQTHFGPAVELNEREFVWTVTSRGQLKPFEEETITAETWGVITKIWEDGTPVRKGDVVLELDTRRMKRRILDREADIRISQAELIRTQQTEGKKKASAEFDVRRAELELQWQKLTQRMLLRGPTEEVFASAKRELDSMDMVAKNRAEELAILEELVEQGFATVSELQRKKLQLAQAKLGLEKQRYRMGELLKGPTELTQREAKLRVQMAEYALESARKEQESTEVMGRSGVSRAKQYLDRRRTSLKQDKEELGKYIVKSPSDGYILHIPPRWGTWTPGRDVWRGARVLSVPSEGKMKVVTRVDQRDVAHIKVGMKCVIEIPARATEIYDGEVILVSKQGQDENDGLDGYTRDFVGKSGRQTFDVEVKLLSHDPELRPDFRARVRFILGAETEALVVPWGAIKRRGTRNTVMVVEASRLVERVVQLGASDDTAVVVTSGCRTGDVILLAYSDL